MNKTAIKNFAVWARNRLIADVIFQAGLAGITESGIAPELPQSTDTVKFYDIGTKDPVSVSGEKIQMRQRLVEAIQEKQKESDYPRAFRFVVEKVAYTWFNRLIAIRFMEVNDYLPGRIRVLSSENQMKAEPDIVTNPFDADLKFTQQERQNILQMKDENRLDELFRFLFIRQCHQLHDALPVLFDSENELDRKDSYLDMLLTISYTDKDGVLWRLIHDIQEDVFNVEKEGQIEIIGWMYQYYNTEPKDQVFANLKKNIKINKDNIPAATQLFTPDWIVRYMVENSLGRLWVEGHPNEELKQNWKYYLEEAEQEPEVQAQLTEIRKEYAALHPEEMKVIDPCSGSGHILVYLFEVLMQIYESQGWTQREAAQSIVQNNLYGLDIDDRAAQLAYFAVMMKARQYDRKFLERRIVPHIYGIQESNGINREQIKLFGKGMSIVEKNNAVNQLNEMLDALVDAKEYGSILNVPELDWDLLRRYMAEIDDAAQISIDSIGIDEAQVEIQRLIDQAQAMGQKYHAVVTNPPYMGSSGMGAKLSQYVKDHYPDSKSDLFAVFIEHIRDMLIQNVYQAMITQHAWMFLSSYEKLRGKLQTIDMVNMTHLGARAFEEIGGEVVQTTAFVLQNVHIAGYKGTYCRLVEPITQQGKEDMFVSGKNRYIAKQDNFIRIPGAPVAYWVNQKLIENFERKSISDYADTRRGLQTGNSPKFIRFWYEIDISKMSLIWSRNARESEYKWFALNSGGSFRRWYGNIVNVVNWYHKGRDIKSTGSAIIPSEDRYFDCVVSWNKISSGTLSVRYQNAGIIPGDASPYLHSPGGDIALLKYVMAMLNSKVSSKYAQFISPTLNFEVGNIAKLPLIVSNFGEVGNLTDDCILLSRTDWDSFETSWDFQRHPLLPAPTEEIKDQPSSTLSEPTTTYQPDDPIDDKTMEFAIFCVENIASDIHRDAIEVYDLLTRDSDILYSYIIPCYEPLHTQDKGYICEDIEQVMQERGLIG
ncbi:MAG: BREX-1 system adenine-specific DNA-methyltransferase PglX [Clostridia bacterium]|nr:BREX-1 system adenine-specific DNA-methyltransferase PglX [Clostridia bacterium]